MSQSTEEESALRQQLNRAIHDALDGIRYGSVEIIVHDGRIVQIERKEKIRPGELPREPKQ